MGARMTPATISHFRHATILAGGYGRRMWPLTAQVPIALLPVNGLPFIDYILAKLKSCSFTHVTILTCHYREQVKRWVGAGAAYGLEVDFATDNGRGVWPALRGAHKHLPPATTVTYGDTLLPSFDYSLPERYLNVNPGIGWAMSVYRGPHTGTEPNVTLDRNEWYVANKSPMGAGATHVEAGVWAIRKESLLSKEAIVTGALHAYDQPLEIGSPKGYEFTCRALA